MTSPYQLGKWRVTPAGGGSSEPRTLPAGCLSETLSALTLAEARGLATASPDDQQRAAGAAEDVVGGVEGADTPTRPGTLTASFDGPLLGSPTPASLREDASRASYDKVLKKAAFAWALDSKEPTLEEEPGAGEPSPEFYDAPQELSASNTESNTEKNESASATIPSMAESTLTWSMAECAAAVLHLPHRAPSPQQ